MMNKQVINIALLTGWAIAFAYFFGQLMWNAFPFAWPFNVIVGYASGVVAALALAYFVISKIKPIATRTTVALVTLAFVGVVSATLTQLSVNATFTRLEIQELRDNAALGGVKEN